MAITFTKMHSLGNDFMVVNTIGQAINWQPQTIRLLGCRNTGVGFDQCLLLAPPNAQNVDFFYRIFCGTFYRNPFCFLYSNPVFISHRAGLFGVDSI